MASAGLDAQRLGRFRLGLEDSGGRLHETDSLDAARSLASELIGGASVAAWADPRLEGLAPNAAAPADAEVSLIVADVAIADTGQVGFAHSADRPPSADLLPTRQIALVAAGDLVDTVSEALGRWFGGGNGAGGPPGNAVLVAGPSRTSDIEQRSIRGVHAPRDLDVIVYGEPG